MRRRTASRSMSGCSTPRPTSCPRPRSSSRTSTCRPSVGLQFRSYPTSLVTSGYSEADHLAFPGFAHLARRRGRRLGGRPVRTPVASPADGHVLDPLPRLQGLARGRARDPRGPPPGRPCRGGRSGDRRREHVLRDERGRSQVSPRRRPCGSHASARLCDRLRREPRRRRVRGAAGERRRRLPQERGDAGLRGRRRRRDRLRAGRRAARPRPRLRPRAGRLQLLVQLLRDPARAGAVAQPPGRGRARARWLGVSSRAIARSCSPASTSAAFAIARTATRCRGSSARPARRPGSGACGSRRSR